MRNEKHKTTGHQGHWLYEQLYQQAPFNIAVIDREFNIIAANDNFTEFFGRWKGRKCYSVYRKLSYPCVDCSAALTFEDGRKRISDQTGVDRKGREAHYIIHVAPLRTQQDGPVDFVIEMSRNIIDTRTWQREYQLLFDRVPCYITVIDRNYKIIRANESFRENFGDVEGRQCYEVYKQRTKKCPNCPAAKTFRDGQVHHSNQVGIKAGGDKTYYYLSTSPLSRPGQEIAHVIEISTDITETRRLEKEIIEAERLAAVGQTVAGLAHSIKNILMGLEGGMYIVRKALKKDNREMLAKGWEMLERNFDKTTSLVRDFLSFSKGRIPELEMVNPNDLVSEIVKLYREIAGRVGVSLTAELDPRVRKAPLDPKGIHTCLTNLVSNAIDACQMSETKNCRVTITTRDKRGSLCFTVTDNGCGIDHEIKSRIFTTFFTTKGGQGTGLGLLTTKKIVKEHGGKISVRSKKDEGTEFAMTFPRKRLLDLLKESEAE